MGYKRNPLKKIDPNTIILLGVLWYAYSKGWINKILGDVKQQLPGGDGNGNGNGGGGGTPSARLQQIVAINPNAVAQMLDWISQRKANGENPCDWYALRNHYVGIGAPDPGDPAPPEFNTWCH